MSESDVLLVALNIEAVSGDDHLVIALIRTI